MSLIDSPRKRRDRMYIMAEILEVAIDGALKTQLMYRANLSFAQLNEYLRLLLDMKLLDIAENSGKTFYKTTTKGLRYIQSYKDIRDLLRKERARDPPHNGNPGVLLVKRGSQVVCTKGPF